MRHKPGFGCLVVVLFRFAMGNLKAQEIRIDFVPGNYDVVTLREGVVQLGRVERLTGADADLGDSK